VLSRTRLGLAAGLAAASLAAACGGSLPGGGGLPEGAELLAAGTPVLVSVSTDFESEQWQAVEALLERFPAGAGALDSLFDELTGDSGLDFASDVQPALGDEVDLALLDLPRDGEPTIAMVLRPDDPQALEQLLAREGGDPPVTREVDGWYVLAETQADIDRALAGDGESLAESERFESAMGELPDGALARFYVDGPALLEGLGSAFEESGANAPNPFDLLGVGSLEAAAFAVSAEEAAVRVEGIARAADAPALETTAVTLDELVPADALAYVGTAGAEEAASQLLDAVGAQTEDFDQALAQIELALGVSLEDDVLPILAGETALYVRAGAPIPEVTVLLTPEDPQRALATLDKLVAGISALEAASGAEAPPAATDTTVAGVPAKQLQLGEVTLLYAVVDDRLVITTAVKGIADLASDTARLADDADYRDALEASGAPDEAAAVAYVDLAGALDALETVDAFGALDAELLANLEPLRHLVVHASGEEGEARFSGLLAIE
jgi:hypothetical protein